MPESVVVQEFPVLARLRWAVVAALVDVCPRLRNARTVVLVLWCTKAHGRDINQQHLFRSTKHRTSSISSITASSLPNGFGSALRLSGFPGFVAEEVFLMGATSLMELLMNEKIERLKTLLSDMDIPPARRTAEALQSSQDLRWLDRNMFSRNQQHPHFREASALIAELLSLAGQRSIW